MAALQQVLSVLREFLVVHSVDFESELQRYDYRRTGVVMVGDFRRWIASLGLALPNQSIQLILMGYEKREGVDLFRLVKDLKSASEPSQPLGLSAKPDCKVELVELAAMLVQRHQTIREALDTMDPLNTGRVSVNSFYRAFGASPSMRTIAEAYAANDSIEYLKLGRDVNTYGKISELATFMKNRGLDARPIFMYQDRLMTGRVDVAQFRASLASFGAPMTPMALKTIAEAYEDQPGTCDYNEFLRGLEGFARTSTMRMTHEIPDELIKAADPATVLEQIKRVVEERQIDVEMYMNGIEEPEIQLSQFRKLIELMKLNVEKDEVATLARMFPGRCGGIDWRKFTDSIARRVVVKEVTAEEVIDKLRKFLENAYLRFGDRAVRFDKEGSGSISPGQLISALRAVKFDVGTAEVIALKSAYPGATPDSVDWRAISEAVDPKRVTVVSERDMELRRAETEQGNATPDTVMHILQKLAAGAKSCGISLFDELRAMDRNGSGVVQQQSFVAFIDSLPILPARMTQSETRAIVTFYRVVGSSNLDYIGLCKDLNRAEFRKAEDAKTASMSQIQESTVPKREIPDAVHVFMRRFKLFCEQMRVVALDIFKRYDNMRSGTLPAFKVQACFGAVNFPVMRMELEQVISVFPGSRGDSFNYTEFLHQVELEDIVSEEARATLSPAPITSEVAHEVANTCCQIHQKLIGRHRSIDVAFVGIASAVISIQEFKDRLVPLDLVLRTNQLQAIIRNYRVNLTDQINWKAFCADVNASKTVGY